MAPQPPRFFFFSPPPLPPTHTNARQVGLMTPFPDSTASEYSAGNVLQHWRCLDAVTAITSPTGCPCPLKPFFFPFSLSVSLSFASSLFRTVCSCWLNESITSVRCASESIPAVADERLSENRLMRTSIMDRDVQPDRHKGASREMNRPRKKSSW